MIKSDWTFKQLLTLILLLPTLVIFAQTKRTTEAVVNIEKVFIEATREKILGNYENAAVLFKEVLRQDKVNHAAAYELSRLYDVLDKDDKALQSIKMAIALDGSNEWYQMFLADVHQKQGDNLESAKLYEKLAKSNPTVEYYYSKWAYFLVRAKEPEKAVKVYNIMEKKYGINPEYSRKKKTLWFSVGDHKKAAEEIKRLIKSAPQNIDYRLDLAEFYEQIGDQENAKKTYAGIIEIEPENAVAKIALAGDMKKQGRDDSYLSSLKPVFQDANVNIDVKIKELIPYVHKIASDNSDTELTNTAIELADILEQVHPTEAKSYSVHGDLLYYSGKERKALEKYNKTIELDQSIFTVWEQIMYIHALSDELDELIDVSERAMDYFPNHAKAYYFNGIGYNQKAKHKEAKSSLEQALIMAGKNNELKVDIYKNLGEAYFYLKKYDQSFDAYEKALAMNPDAANVLNDYSFFLSQKSGGDLDKAKNLIEKANKLSPNNAVVQDTYALVLYKLKDYKSAKSWIEKAIANGGAQHPAILEHYGDILYQMDDKDNAILQWQKSKEIGNTSELLDKKISNRQLYEQ